MEEAMLKLSTGILVVWDETGASQAVIAPLADSPIRFFGLETAKGPVEYEGTGQGLRLWAAQHGFRCELHEVDLDLDSRTVLKWEISV